MLYVWSLFVRTTHWLLVSAFTVAFLTRDDLWYEGVHVKAGYLAGGIMIARIIWGIVAKGYCNFAKFPFRPVEGLRYAWQSLTGHAKRFIGHNPAGSLVIYAMLTVGLATVATGILHFYEAYFDWADGIGEIHKTLAWTWLALVGTHVSGVIVESILLKENLIASMITGFKQRHPHAKEGHLSAQHKHNA